MASIYEIKPAFQRLLRPLTRRLAQARVTANMVTVAACVVSLAVGAWLWLQPAARAALLAVPLWLFLRMALNAIDGMLAREHHMQTKLGAVLNELGDVVSDAALYLAFGRIAGMSLALAAVITVLAVITEMTGVVAVQIGASRRYDGPMGKSDRAFVFGAIALLLGLGVPPGRWLLAAQSVLVLLLCITIFNRARRALREVS